MELFYTVIFLPQLLGFMYSWLTFYHQGHEVAQDYKPQMTELQTKIQKVSSSRKASSLSSLNITLSIVFQTRENFNASRQDIHALMMKMIEIRSVVSLFKLILNDRPT